MSRGPCEPLEQQDVDRIVHVLKQILYEIQGLRSTLIGKGGPLARALRDT